MVHVKEPVVLQTAGRLVVGEVRGELGPILQKHRICKSIDTLVYGKSIILRYASTNQRWKRSFATCSHLAGHVVDAHLSEVGVPGTYHVARQGLQQLRGWVEGRAETSVASPKGGSIDSVRNRF